MLSELGAVSVEAIVAGDKLSDYDLGILSAAVSPYPIAGPDALSVKASVMNYGIKAITGFDISCESDGVEPIVNHFSQELASGEMCSLQFVVNPGVATDSDTKWRIGISGIDGASDQLADNNTIEALCTFLKCVLIEEFTTERCPNCPNAAILLHQALQNSDYDGRVFALCHHSGFYSDDFTTRGDREFEWFYGNMNTYAPALMFNRARNPETARTEYSALFTPSSVEMIDKAIAYELDKTANMVVGISHDGKRDADALNVKVSGLRNKNLSAGQLYLTVYLTEDNVKAKDQSGAVGEYYHQHLIRDYTSVWGEPVEWNEDSFDYECSFPIDSNWKFDDLGVLAMVSYYDPDSPLNSTVENSAFSRLTDNTGSSVGSLVRDNDANEMIFDLQGRRYESLEGLDKGIYIVGGRKIKL